jgi:hypothetical protein
MEKLLQPVELNNVSYESKKFRFQKRLVKFIGVLTICTLFFTNSSYASHFRHGNMSWRVVSGRTIEFKITQAWRRSFYGGNIVVGSVVPRIDRLNFGDGTVAFFNLNVTAVSIPDDFFYGEATVTKTYSSDANFTAFFTSCCKVSNLQNNANGSWRVETVVTVGNNNNSPVSTLPALVNLAINQTNATFTVPVADSDGDALTFRLATQAEMLGTNPAGFSVSSNGVATFNTVGKAVGQLWNSAIAITDSRGAKTVVDFLIKITQQSTPPTFNYLTTPTNGQVFQTSPGQNVSFSINAADTDPGDLVTLQAVGVPPGAALNPGLPLTSNPVQSNFSWTPSASNLGTTVINFIAQDAQGVQSNTSVTILVSLKPVFKVPPTPIANSTVFVTAGQSISQNIQVSDPDPDDKVQIVNTTGLPVGASFSNPLPGVANNPYTNTLNWTPSISQWGVNTITLTARDTYGDKTNHTFGYVVNSKPTFTSSQASTSVVAGQLFTYNITANDVDVAFGDALEIMTQQVLPSWLSLTDNGDGTAILSGTPLAADAGDYNVNLVLEDVFHHNGGMDNQSFTITVVTCNTTLSSTISDVSCAGSSDGSINLTINGGTEPFTYSWSTGATTKDLASLAVGNYTVTVTDANNCTETLTASVLTTPDVTFPIVLVQNKTIQLDASGSATITAADIDNGSTDNCSIASIVLDKTAFIGANIGNNTVILTVTDVNGNKSATTAIVTVEDKIAPIFTLTQANVIVALDANNGTASLVSYIGNATATDNSGAAVVITQSPAIGTLLVQNVPLTVTLTATDAFSNFVSQTFTVAATDQTAPIVLSNNITVNLTASGDVSITPRQIDNGSTDNVGIASITLDKLLFTCANVGDNVVTLTVTDASGNSTSTTATVNVKDVTAPTITAPISFTVSNDIDNCGTVVNYVTPTAADNCSVVTSANVVHVLNRGQQFYNFADNRFETQNSPGLPLTFMPTDGQKMAVFLQNGGSTHFLYQNVTLPTSGPILLTYDLKYTNHNGSFSENQFIAVQIRNASTDALLRTVFKTNPGAAGSIPMTSYSFDISEFAGQNVRLQLVDATINSFFLDVLLDNVKITGSSLVNGSFETGDYTGWTAFSSNSGAGTWGIGSGPGTTIVQTAGLASGLNFPVGSTINTFKATDASGNVIEKSFTVTVEDKQPPTVLTQNATIQLNAAGQATITVSDINNGSTDNCSIASIALSKTAFDCSNVGANTVTLTVTDVNGNVTKATAVVTVEDKIAPIIVSKPILVTLTASGTVSITSQDVLQSGTDNCSAPITYSLSQSTFGATDAINSPVTVQLIGTDTSRNATSVPVLVTVIDPVPVVITQNITVALDVNGNATITPQQIDNGSSSVVGLLAEGGLVLDKATFGCSNIGVNTVKLTVTSSLGSTAFATAIVTVIDTIKPFVLVQNKTIQLDAAGNATITAADINNGSTDNCGIATIVLSKSAFLTENLGANKVTLTVTDIHGNVSSNTATVTVEDLIVPAITAPATITISCGSSILASATGMATVTDNSTLSANITINYTDTVLPSVCGGNFTRTWTATDASNNSSSTEQIISISPAALPTMTVPAAVTISTACGTEPIPSTLPFTNGLSGACLLSGTSLNSTFALVDNTCGGTYIETWTATDACGRALASVSRTVTVNQNLGTLESFVFFSVEGAVGNTGVSTITGDIGTSIGAITGFASPSTLSGSTAYADAATTQAKKDLLNLYIHLSNIPVTVTSHAPVFGNGETLQTGVYAIGAAGSLVGTLTLDGQNNPNALFIFKYVGAFSAAASSKIILTNGLKAANVFWVAEGAISVGASSIMKGNFIAHTGAVSMGAGCDLEGRMLSTTGAVTFDSGNAYLPSDISMIPIICVNTSLSSQAILGSVAKFALFTGAGAVSNLATSGIIGDVGTHAGAITGFETSANTLINDIHQANAVTAQAKIDLQNAYSQLVMRPGISITPTLAGLTLTPRVYAIAGAGTLSSTITLDGQGDPNAEFVIKFGGAFSTGAQSKVILINGTRSCNVFWVTEGAISMGASSFMKGNLIAHNGAVSMGARGNLEGRMLSTSGAISFNTGVAYISYLKCVVISENPISTQAVTAVIEPAAIKIANTIIQLEATEFIAYPNPFGKQTTVRFTLPYQDNNATLAIYDLKGTKIQGLYQGNANADTIYEVQFNGQNLSAGTYFFRLMTSKEVKNLKVIMVSN